MAKFCGKCGSPLSSSSVFCGSCGEPVGNDRTMLAAAGTAPVSPASPRRASGPGFASTATPWIIIAVLAVLIALAAVFMSKRDDSSDDSDTSETDGSTEQTGPAGTIIGDEVVKFVNSTANIRNIPTTQGPDSRVVETLRPGMQVRGQMMRIDSTQTNWFKLSDGRGYVSSINLSDGPPVAQSAMRAPVAGGVNCVVATRGGNLNVRSGPAGNRVGQLPYGARFQMYGDPYWSTGYYWVQIQPADQRYPVGWVASDHINCV